MNPKIDIINLGVSDQERARQFYEDVLGGAVRDRDGGLVVSLGGRASPISLREWAAFAADAGVNPASSGFRGFTLSYIVDSADAVDQLLERAERHGGRISKPPKNAMWGYSAYVTDPDGYLWKVASSKRRPLVARQRTNRSNGRAIKPQEVPLTIGVADMKRAKEFYESGVGLSVRKAYGTKFVMFGGEGESSDLGMYRREALAEDAAVNPEGAGFHGFSITHVVNSAEQVDDLIARATRAGAILLKRAENGAHGSYVGSFADLDGNVWQVASHN